MERQKPDEEDTKEYEWGKLECVWETLSRETEYSNKGNVCRLYFFCLLCFVFPKIQVISTYLCVNGRIHC